MQGDAADEFRRFERQLDEHHKTLELWAKPRPEAIYAVLTIPDAVFLVLMMSPVPPPISGGLSQKLKGSEEGVAQSLRWLCGDGVTTVRSVANHALIEAAHHYALFASEYVNIADFHMMYGRGFAKVAIDSVAKVITFDSIEGPGLTNILAWHEHLRDQTSRGMDMALGMSPSDIVKSQQALAGIKYDLIDGRVILGKLPDNLVSDLGGTLLTTRRLEHVPMPPGADLIGFSVDDFWKFTGAVTAWSLAAFLRYLRCVKSGVPQHQCMPTQVVDEAVFIEQVCRLSALSPAITRAVLDRLTFRPSPKSDILLTPFLRSGGMVAWSPTVVINMRHERNLLKVMTRGPKALRDHAATLNGMRDAPLARLISSVFNKRGYQFKVGQQIAAQGEETDVDVLLWRADKSDEVLLIEAKALLPPDEINEVSDAVKVMLYAQEQSHRASRILKAIPTEEKCRMFKFVPWERVRSYSAVVVTSDAEPHTLVDPSIVPVISFNTLRSRFRSRDFASPQRFSQACKERAWLRGEVEEGELGHIDLRIGDLTYRLPVRVVEADAAKLGGGKLAQMMKRSAGSGS